MKKSPKLKNHPNKFGRFKKSLYLCTRFRKIANKVDPLAQSVEHNTFNVGVLGSSPKRITKNNPQETEYQSLADFSFYIMRHICTTNYLLLPNVHGLQNPLYQGV